MQSDLYNQAKIDTAELLDLSLNAFFVLDEEGIIRHCNAACLRMLGLDAQDVIGQPSYKLDAGRSPREVRQLLDRTRAEGKIEGETYAQRKDGSDLHAAFVLNYIPGRNGASFFGFFQDITERKRAERALRESETRWRTLAEGVNAALFIYQEGQLVYANEGTSRLTGYSPEELIGMPVGLLMHKMYEALYADRIEEARRTGTMRPQYRGPIMTRDGQERWVAMSLSRSLFQGKAAILGVAFDITEQVRMDGALRESQRDRELLARQMTRVEMNERRTLGALLHDGLVQDLAACRLRLNTFRGGAKTDADRETITATIAAIDRAITRSRNLVRDLAQPVLHEFGIDAALAELCDRFQTETGIHVKFRTDGSPKTLSGELLEIGFRGVQELLRNVVKHAGVKEAQVCSRAKGGHLLLWVIDAGIGFSLADLRATVHGEGEGFGLFLLSRRLEQVGGKLVIEMREVKGTRAMIALPLDASGASTQTGEEATAP